MNANRITLDPVVLICSLRYAIGRSTYMPGLIVGEIIRVIDEITVHDRLILLRDLRSDRVLSESLPGGLPNKDEWDRLDAALVASLEYYPTDGMNAVLGSRVTAADDAPYGVLRTATDLDALPEGTRILPTAQSHRPARILVRGQYELWHTEGTTVGTPSYAVRLPARVIADVVGQ